jgi:mRNA-degrading endonuclease toxin of MazEF toxin-antitoxin module
MPRADRGSVWIVDLGLAAKVRPCLVLSVPTDPRDRVLVTVVAHTTSVQGTRFEVEVRAPFLKPGVFDAQQVLTEEGKRKKRGRSSIKYELHPLFFLVQAERGDRCTS